MADTKGFLLSVQSDASPAVTGWPDPEIADGLQVWFFGYLAEPGALRATLGLEKNANHAAIVGAAWRRWRDDVTERVLGEFAAAVVDGPEVAVVADRMGLRPLYFWTVGEKLVVSTDLAVLTRETNAWQALDQEYLADLFGAGQHLGAHTPYRDIRRLQAGERALWQPGRFRVVGGWRPREPDPVGTHDDHQERLRATVARVVSGAVPDGPVAVALSGGLDSSTLLATVPRTTAVHALSFVFPASSGSDETAWIKAALEHDSVPWHPIDGSRHGHFTAGPEFDAFFAAPTPVAFASSLVAAESAAAHSLGVAAILTGEGGDAVFLGGNLPWYLGDLLRTGRLRRLAVEVAKWAEHAQPQRSAIFWLQHAAFEGWRSWRSDRALSLTSIPPLQRSAPWLEQAYITEQRLDGREAAAGPTRAASIHTHGVVQGIVAASETVRSNEALSLRDIEVRHPFLAPPLVDLALATPWSVGVDPCIDRAVQRYAFQGIVAPTTLRRRSKNHPEEAILRGLERNPAWIDFLLDRPEIVARGYANSQRWTSAVREAAVGRVASIRHFGTAIQIEIWLRHMARVGRPQLMTGAIT